MRSVKEDVTALLGTLPEDCSAEDIHCHLHVLAKVRGGLDRADGEGTVTQEEAEARLAKWLTE